MAPGEFHTRDLFEQGKLGQWKYLGRKDDLLVHVTGEKTNPVAMESIMNSHHLVRRAAIVGHNRPYNIMVTIVLFIDL